MKDLAEIKPQYPDESLPQQIQGHQLYFAPIAAITAQSGSPTTGGSNNLKTGDSNVILNLQARVADLENALIKLGLLKHG